MYLPNVRPVLREIGLLAVLGAFFALLAAAVLIGSTQRMGSSSALVDMSPTQLSQGAQLIVEGKVLAQTTTTRQSSSPPSVTTLTTIGVQRVHKGTSASTITVRTHGGQNGNLVEVAEDEPSFAAGDRVFLFLLPVGDGTWQVLGGFQGRYRVSGETARNEKHTVGFADLQREAQSAR